MKYWATIKNGNFLSEIWVGVQQCSEKYLPICRVSPPKIRWN
jgi:hypothetical protein